MKIVKIVTSLLVCSLLFACGGAENADSSDADVTNDSTYIVSEETENTLILDEISYAEDWLAIRNAILEGNEETLTHYMVFEGDVTAMEIIRLCQEDWVKEDLEGVVYSDLSETDMNGELLKEFAADVITEVDGEEYGSAVFIYMKETDTGLEVTDVLAAG